jgi:hypothetical protein
MNSSQANAGFGVGAGDNPPLLHEDLTVPRPTGQSTRVEPKLMPPGSRKPTYDELRALAALYEPPAVAPKRRIKHAGIIAMIFAVGTTVGFGVTSLIDGEISADARFPYLRGTQAFPDHGNGISSGELPFDGKAANTSPRYAQETSSGFNAAELPYGGDSSGGGMQERESTATPSLPEPEIVPVVPKVAEKAPPLVAQAPKPAQKNASRTENKAVAQPHRERQARRTDKDREIERIRQQAAEELKKKGGSVPQVDAARKQGLEPAEQKSGRKAGAAAGRGRLPAMAAMLEQCEQAGNFILREQCKWQLCGGRWGKNGCPSYPQRTTSLN